MDAETQYGLDHAAALVSAEAARTQSTHQGLVPGDAGAAVAKAYIAALAAIVASRIPAQQEQPPEQSAA